MAKKTKSKAERYWLSKISYFGCVVCQKFHEVNDAPPACCHHIRDGMGVGQKNSHYKVLPLCHHHHQSGGHGEAFHAGQKVWEEKYGTEEELLSWVLERIDND